MNTPQVLATLRKLGKPQTAAIYRRHGSGQFFGVLTSEIAKLQKRLKVNHSLAMELWKTGNAEARALALLVADPEKLTRSDAGLPLHRVDDVVSPEHGFVVTRVVCVLHQGVT